MTVSELVKFLQNKPQDMLVAYELHSEQCLMLKEQIEIKEFCEPRSDGWIHDKRPDMPSRKYLLFPGN